MNLHEDVSHDKVFILDPIWHLSRLLLWLSYILDVAKLVREMGVYNFKSCVAKKKKIELAYSRMIASEYGVCGFMIDNFGVMGPTWKGAPGSFRLEDYTLQSLALFFF